MEINTIEEFKEFVQSIFGEEIIMNNEFEEQFDKLKDSQVESFVEWCENVSDGGTGLNKAYTKDYVCFIKKFGSINRSIIVKIKNGEYIEFHLGDHKYYEKQLKELAAANQVET